MAGEGPVMNPGAGVIPGTGIQSTQQGDPFGSIMKEAIPSIPDDMVKKALFPTFGGHQLSVPGRFTQPIPDFKPAPLDNREVVGKGNARARGIGNSITALGNFVGQYATAKAKLKQTQNASKVSQLIEYQQAIDQAGQILKEDPNNAEAKAALEKNKHNRDAMFEDPKFVKMVQKGFNISFTDPEANKTDEHAAVQQGIQDAKQKAQKAASSYGEQWANKQPTQMQPNVLAQQQLTMAVQQQQAYAKVAAAVIPKLITARDTMTRVQYVQGMQNARQISSQMFQMWKLDQQFANNKSLASLRHQYRLGEISTSIQQTGQKALELFQAEKLDPTTLFKEETDFAQKAATHEASFNSAIAGIQQQIATTQAAMTKPGTSGALKSQLQNSLTDFQQQLKSVQIQQQNYQSFKNSWYGMMSNMKAISAGMSGGDGNGAGAGASQQPVSTGQPTTSSGPNTFDPQALLNNQPWNFGGAGTSAILPASSGESSSDDDEEDDNN